MNIPTYNSGLLQVKAYRILQSRVSSTLLKFNLNPTSWALIGQVYESKNGVRSSEIAQILDVEPPLITVLVGNLEKMKLIERHNHPQDHRAKLLFLTRQGKELIPQVEDALRKTLLLLLEGISNEDLEAYKRVLEGIINNENAGPFN